jgi:hypothetical protein
MRILRIFPLSLAALCIGSVQVAAAADKDGAFAIDGIGSQPCSRFSEAAAAKDDKSVITYISWMNGFISGHNLHTDGTFDVTPWQTTELLILKMQAFCQANPETPFAQGVGGLIGSLAPHRLQSASEKVSVRNRDKAVVLYRETLESIRLALGNKGYKVPARSNDFDETFAAALEAFQADTKVPVTGLPDQLTLNALFP